VSPAATIPVLIGAKRLTAFGGAKQNMRATHPESHQRIRASAHQLFCRRQKKETPKGFFSVRD
jgi:hypothetical protein